MSDPSELPVPPAETLVGTLGIEVLEAGPELARARVPVTNRVKQPFGLVHGGLFASVAETLASVATYLAVQEDGMMAVGQSNYTTFIRPIVDGTVHAEARRIHRGRTTWLWDVECSDDEGRVCAITRMTMAVRPAG